MNIEELKALKRFIRKKYKNSNDDSYKSSIRELNKLIKKKQRNNGENK